jgi:class 3 adenylate cyclase
MPTVRRLAAILAADVAGYSRPMETELDAMAEAASILALITR